MITKNGFFDKELLTSCECGGCGFFQIGKIGSSYYATYYGAYKSHFKRNKTNQISIIEGQIEQLLDRLVQGEKGSLSDYGYTFMFEPILDDLAISFFYSEKSLKKDKPIWDVIINLQEFIKDLKSFLNEEEDLSSYERYIEKFVSETQNIKFENGKIISTDDPELPQFNFLKQLYLTLEAESLAEIKSYMNLEGNIETIRETKPGKMVIKKIRKALFRKESLLDRRIEAQRSLNKVVRNFENTNSTDGRGLSDLINTYRQIILSTYGVEWQSIKRSIISDILKSYGQDINAIEKERLPKGEYMDYKYSEI